VDAEVSAEQANDEKLRERGSLIHVYMLVKIAPAASSSLDFITGLVRGNQGEGEQRDKWERLVDNQKTTYKRERLAPIAHAKTRVGSGGSVAGDLLHNQPVKDY